MKQRVGNCPACGAPVEFKLSTALVTVCDSCHSVVARGDKKLEDHGKVADLVETNSPIYRGSTGKFERKSFEVVGRVQYRHPAGGVWDEWYLQFPNGRVGWLAEAQGKFYLMSERRQSDKSGILGFEDLSIGQTLDLSEGKHFTVAEKGVATAISADGNIPWAFRPNAEHRFADLHGKEKAFGTIEYDVAGPRLFLGREVTLQELELKELGWEAQAYASPNTTALQVNCPHCAGPLKLVVPDQTLRVCCPNCHSLLDCQQGKLEYLQTLRAKVEKPIIPLGSVGELFGTKYTVIGFMVRYAKYQGKTYPWSEYLLYEPSKGFRWLVRNKGHWSFVEPVPVAAVGVPHAQECIYEEKSFKLFDQGPAYVRYVAGEFYWRVSVDEVVQASDYIAPPQMISFERSKSDKGDELNVSLGTYVSTEVIEAAFGLEDLATPWEVGPIQPKPVYTDVWLLWVGFVAVMILMALVLSVQPFYLLLSLVGVSIWPIALLIANYSFEVNRWHDSDYSPYAASGEAVQGGAGLALGIVGALLSGGDDDD